MQPTTLRANTEIKLDPKIRYFLKVSIRVKLNFSYKGATQGAGIFIDDALFATIWASPSGSVGQVFSWSGYIQGSSLKLMAQKTNWVTSQPSHFDFTSSELYY